MKNIDYMIAQSEAEWRRSQYERMDIRESAGRLCQAVKRSARKRLNCAARTLRAVTKRAAFTPTYDERKENIVVSLTSTTGRVRHIFPTLYSLAVQTRRPDLIVLWLGDGAAYSPQTLSGIEAAGVKISYREDLGPNTKYHYAFREYPKDLIITVDDDIIYHEAMIEELYAAHLKHPDLVIARRAHKMRFKADRSPVRYNDWIWECTDTDGPAHDLLATGVGGVLYPPAVTALKCWGNMDFLRVSPGCDDIWLKFCELSNDVRVCAVKNSKYGFDAIYFRSQKTSLSAENVDRGGNDERIRSCAEYFGMRDDLCQRVLTEGQGERI